MRSTIMPKRMANPGHSTIFRDLGSIIKWHHVDYQWGKEAVQGRILQSRHPENPNHLHRDIRDLTPEQKDTGPIVCHRIEDEPDRHAQQDEEVVDHGLSEPA